MMWLLCTFYNSLKNSSSTIFVPLFELSVQLIYHWQMSLVGIYLYLSMETA